MSIDIEERNKKNLMNMLDDLSFSLSHEKAKQETKGDSILSSIIKDGRKLINKIKKYELTDQEKNVVDGIENKINEAATLLESVNSKKEELEKDKFIEETQQQTSEPEKKFIYDPNYKPKLELGGRVRISAVPKNKKPNLNNLDTAAVPEAVPVAQRTNPAEVRRLKKEINGMVKDEKQKWGESYKKWKHDDEEYKDKIVDTKNRKLVNTYKERYNQFDQFNKGVEVAERMARENNIPFKSVPIPKTRRIGGVKYNRPVDDVLQKYGAGEIGVGNGKWSSY